MAKLLLVEDHDLNRKILTKLLKKMGFIVLEAENGEESIRQSAECEPDLILMDINLPDIGGCQAIASIRNAEQTTHIPIIALSAYDDSVTIEQARQSGCNDFDTKPVDLERLVGKIALQLPAERIPSGAQPYIQRAEEIV